MKTTKEKDMKDKEQVTMEMVEAVVLKKAKHVDSNSCFVGSASLMIR